MGDENVELTTFSPLQDDVYDKNEFHLSYVAKFPLGGRVVVSLDGGVLEMNKPGQLSINTGFIDMPIKAESGLHLLQLTILVPVTEDVDLDSLEPQEDMLLQMIVMFNVVENLPADPDFRYPPVDTFCKGFAPSTWMHHCKSAELPAGNTQALVRISDLARGDACCAVVQVSILNQLRPAAQASARIEGLGSSSAVMGNRTEVVCDLGEAPRRVSLTLLDEEGQELENSQQSFEVAMPQCAQPHSINARGDEQEQAQAQEQASGEQEPDKPADRDSAWVTLVFGEAYLEAALTMFHSISTHCRDDAIRDKLILCVEGMLEPAAVEQALKGRDVLVQWVPALSSPHEQMKGREDLRYAYSKLHVWSLHEYRQVVYVDADALLYYCLDDLFSTAAPFAAGTFPISNKFEKLDPSDNRFKINFESLGFGTWVFTAKPSEETYARLLREAAYTGSFDGSDGGLLYNLWPDRYLMPPYTVAWKRSLWRFKSVWQRYPVGGVDFTGKPKPWQPEWLSGVDPGDGIGYLPLYLDWWQHRWDRSGSLPPSDLTAWVSSVQRGWWPFCSSK